MIDEKGRNECKQNILELRALLEEGPAETLKKKQLFFFRNCQNLKPTRHPSVGEQINQRWQIQTITCYGALKRNELSSHDKTGGKLKCI